MPSGDSARTSRFATLDTIDRDDTRPEQAAKDAVDPDRLLEGEDPSTPHADEARHWVDVYSELLTFKERTISSVERNAAEIPEPEAREEAQQTDLSVLQAERSRLRHRLDFWLRRQHELTNE